MQSSTRPSDRQAAIFVSVAVGVLVAVVTTATFWWVYDLTLGRERRTAAQTPVSVWSPSLGVKVLSTANANTPTDGRSPWLGIDAWTTGVQAGQAWVQANPNPINVQVLTGMTTAQIWTYMQQYVSGGLGVSCQYCHNTANFASDEFPQKVAARNMLWLVNDINANYIVNLPNWRGNYVQCATCHNNKPNGLEAFSPVFVKSVPPIMVTVDPLDETGKPITDPAAKPAAIQDPLKLQDAVLYYVYNYQVWKPYDPAVPGTGRGSLALVYDGGRTQDQVTINQNVMNSLAWGLGTNCTYCHNSRNFPDFETDAAGTQLNPLYGWNKLKAQQMLQLTTWLQANWTTYGAIAKDTIPTASEGGASKLSYRLLDGKYYNVPGCYTCHQGKQNNDGLSVPLGAINQTSIPSGDAGIVVFPPAIRGNK